MVAWSWSGNATLSPGTLGECWMLSKSTVVIDGCLSFTQIYTNVNLLRVN